MVAELQREIERYREQVQDGDFSSCVPYFCRFQSVHSFFSVNWPTAFAKRSEWIHIRSDCSLAESSEVTSQSVKETDSIERTNSIG